MMKRLQTQSGFTLMELILVVALMGVLIVGVEKFGMLALDLKVGQNIVEAMRGEASEACYRFAREARGINSDAEVFTAAVDDFQFMNSDGEDVRYWLNGASLMRNNTQLAVNVSSLQFNYYDGDDQVIASPLVSPSTTDIRMIRMNLTLTDEGRNFALEAKAKPRNF